MEKKSNYIFHVNGIYYSHINNDVSVGVDKSEYAQDDKKNVPDNADVNKILPLYLKFRKEILDNIIQKRNK